MAKPRIRLVVAGSNPFHLMRCLAAARKAVDYIKPYADLSLVISMSPGMKSGIMVEDVAFIECEDEEEVLEKLIVISADIAMNRKIAELASAALGMY